MDCEIYNGKRLRDGMKKLLDDHHWHYFVTANLNSDATWERARSLLRSWHARIDRQLIGPKWARKTDLRTKFIAFFEGEKTNPHWHLMLRLNKREYSRFERQAPPIWRELTKSGTMDVKLLLCKRSQLSTGSYSPKRIWHKQSYEQFVISSEFVTDNSNNPKET